MHWVELADEALGGIIEPRHAAHGQGFDETVGVVTLSAMRAGGSTSARSCFGSG